MQMQQPSYFPSGISSGRPNGSTMTGAPLPIAYIALPISEPLQQSQQVLWQQPMKQPGLTEPLRKAIAGLGAAQIFVGLSSILLEIVTLVIGTYNFAFFAGLWCGPIFLVTGIVACVAAKARKTGPIIATMVLSIISAILFSCQFSFSMVQYFSGRNSVTLVTSGLLTALSGFEFIFSIALAACCCQAICRHGCCCENIDQSRPQYAPQIDQNSFANQSWTANPYQPNVGQQPYSPAPGFPLQSQSSYYGPAEISGEEAGMVGTGDGAGPSSSLST